MNDRFTPIAVGKVAPAPTHIPAPAPSMALLYQAMDDTAAYAQSLLVHINPRDIDALVTREECREVTLARLVNNRDTADALEWLHERGEFPDHFWARLEEVELEMAERRINKEQA